MKTITISKDDILENFEKLGAIPEELHRKLVEEGNIKIDKFNDLEIDLDGEKYWVTTVMFITRANNAGEYRIDIQYEIHKDSKYSKVEYSFIR